MSFVSLNAVCVVGLEDDLLCFPPLVNLPPTLSKSQVSSVRKNLKMQMLQLLRQPASVDYHTQITTLLTDLGATQSEVGIPSQLVTQNM